MTSDMIEMATGLSDVDQQVDDKGPLDSEKNANLTVYTIAWLWYLYGPFEWLLRFHQHINWELGLVIIFI